MIWAKHYLPTATAFAAVWLLLTDANSSSWVIGIPAILAAVWVATHRGANRHSGLSLSGLLRFLPFFLRESL